MGSVADLNEWPAVRRGLAVSTAIVQGGHSTGRINDETALVTHFA
jgi:hypothetical protein